MNPSRCRLTRLFRYVAVVVALSTMPAAAQVASRPFREAFVVETDATAEKKLAAVAEYVAQRRWEAAIALLREVATTPDALVRVSPTRSVSLSRYCDILLTQLPPEGLAIYRQGIDPQAAVWFAEAEMTGDERPLRSIAEKAFASSFGDRAVFLLAERAWERGEFDLARRYGTMLVPIATSEGEKPLAILRSPVANLQSAGRLDLARIRARLILCSVALGEYDRASRELEAFRTLHPEATGFLAGNEGLLADLLSGILSAAADGSAANNRIGWDILPLTPATHTLGSRADRAGLLTQELSAAQPIWSRSLPHSERTAESDRFPSPRLPTLAYYPVVWNDHVFVADAERVHGFDLKTGQAAWSVADDDPGVLYPPTVAPADPADADAALDRIGQARPIPPAPSIGKPRHTLTVDGNRLYARLGSPVTAWPAREFRQPDSTIVCLDLAREGLLTWSLSASTLGEKDEAWAFEGPPVAVGDRLYVLASRGRPQAQLNAICLDAKAGTILWNVAVGAPMTWPPEGMVVMSHRLVTVAAGHLYVQTNHGAVVCLDADRGRTVWVGWYESRPRADGPSANAMDLNLPSACLTAGGVVVAAPSDSDRLLAYDAASGIQLWSRTIRGGGRTLIGATDGRVFVSGDRLSCLDLFTGRELWSAGFEDPPGTGSGRGLLAGGYVFWPTREDLLVVDAETGDLVRRLPLKELYGFVGGGNLAAGPGRLLLARPDGIVAFGAP